MRTEDRVLLDACVLANHAVCDLLLRLAESPRLFLPHWSESIMGEVLRTHEARLGWPSHLASSFQRQVKLAFPEAMIGGYESLIEVLENDPGDRHVLAAAICGKCRLILTFNLRHFPVDTLAPWRIEASHPQDFLCFLYERDPDRVLKSLGEIAGRKKLEIRDLLLRLHRVMPEFCRRVLDDGI